MPAAGRLELEGLTDAVFDVPGDTSTLAAWNGGGDGENDGRSGNTVLVSGAATPPPTGRRRALSPTTYDAMYAVALKTKIPGATELLATQFKSSAPAIGGKQSIRDRAPELLVEATRRHSGCDESRRDDELRCAEAKIGRARHDVRD